MSAERKLKESDPNKAHAERLGVTDREIRNWITAGKRANPPEHPPLEDPAKLAEWWQRCMRPSRRIPAHILSMAARAAPAANKADFPAQANEPQSFAATLNRRRVAEEQAHDLYNMLARQAKDPALGPKDRGAVMAQMELARRAWDSIAETLRKSELSAEKINKASGRTLQADDVLAADRAIHFAIAEGIRGMWGVLRGKMLICTSEAEEDALWQAECDRLFTRLRDREFGMSESLGDGKEVETPEEIEA